MHRAWDCHIIAFSMYGQLLNSNLCERFRNTLVLAIVYTYWYGIIGAAPLGGGAKGAKAPLKISRKGKFKNMGHAYFHASKLLKLALLSSLTRKYDVLWKGFYHNFSTKRLQVLFVCLFVWFFFLVNSHPNPLNSCISVFSLFPISVIIIYHFLFLSLSFI